MALVGVILSCVSANGDKRPDWTTYEGKNWGVKVKPFVYVNPNVKYGRLDGEVRYDINKKLSVTGSGWRDTTRNWGAGIGFRYRWKRDASHMVGLHCFMFICIWCRFTIKLFFCESLKRFCDKTKLSFVIHSYELLISYDCINIITK